MKKFLVTILILGLIFAGIIFCVSLSKKGSDSNSGSGYTSVTNPIDLVTLKLEDTSWCKNCSIKFGGDNYDMAASYYVTPEGFDWEKLEQKGYKMSIKVTYDVYYEKDWNLPLGYMGSPKYEISIVNSDGMGQWEEDLPTTTSSKTKTFSVSARAADLKNKSLVLSFSTDNIQNVIHFKNIKVEYQCYK